MPGRSMLRGDVDVVMRDGYSLNFRPKLTTRQNGSNQEWQK